MEAITTQPNSTNIFKRYETEDLIVTLTPVSFAYRIWLFELNQIEKRFIIKSLYAVEVRDILHSAGYRRRLVGIDFIYVQIQGFVIREVSTQMMRDYLTEFIDVTYSSANFEHEGNVYSIPPEALKEIYLKTSKSLFSDTFLNQLQQYNAPLLRDKKDEIYFCFKNGLVTVTDKGLTHQSTIENCNFCVWEDQIIPHEFTPAENFKVGNFYRFLRNVTGNNEHRFDAMTTGIGYVIHQYFNESEGQAVVLYDEVIIDVNTPMGGSGKGLIVNGIKQVRRVSKVDGKHLDTNNRFKWEQITPSTQVAWLDDVKPNFNFSLLYSNLTDGWTVERKNKSQLHIPAEHSPKTIICSNNILKGRGTSDKRRQHAVELSDYYSKQIITGTEKPIEQTHGGIFFSKDGWDVSEWNKFFSTMLYCAQSYLASGLVHFEGVNIELNYLKQLAGESFIIWANSKEFTTDTKYFTAELFDEFSKLYYPNRLQLSQRQFTEFLAQYGVYRKWKFERKQSASKTFFHYFSI